MVLSRRVIGELADNLNNMPNKEQKQFKKVIKKRNKRVVRVKHVKEIEASHKKFKWIPAPVIEKKDGVGSKLLKKLHLK